MGIALQCILAANAEVGLVLVGGPLPTLLSTPTSMMERCSVALCIKKSTKILKLPSIWDGPPTRTRPTSALAASMHWRAMRGFVLRSTTDQKLDWDTNRSFVPALLYFYQP